MAIWHKAALVAALGLCALTLACASQPQPMVAAPADPTQLVEEFHGADVGADEIRSRLPSEN